MPSEAGKGSENYHNRQQCSNKMMDLRYSLAFAKDDETRDRLKKEIAELEAIECK